MQVDPSAIVEPLVPILQDWDAGDVIALIAVIVCAAIAVPVIHTVGKILNERKKLSNQHKEKMTKIRNQINHQASPGSELPPPYRKSMKRITRVPDVKRIEDKSGKDQ